jgi:putative DNA primase/helicase
MSPTSNAPSEAEHKHLPALVAFYRANGWHTLVLKPSDKRPVGDEWQKRPPAEVADFKLNSNIGIALGKLSGGLVDVDFDWPEAAAVAHETFKECPGFGRASNKFSHRLVFCTDLPEQRPSRTFKLGKEAEALVTGRTMVVEMRANGQTMFPPSIHPSGELVSWEPGQMTFAEFTRAKLVKLCGLTAFLAVVVRYYPRETGARDEVCLALAGSLVAAGYMDDEIGRYVELVARLAEDDEWAKRNGERKAANTREKIVHDEPAMRLNRLCDLLGIQPMHGSLDGWLDLNDEPVVIERPVPKSEEGSDRTVLSYETPMRSAEKFLLLPGWTDLLYYNSDYLRYRAGAYIDTEDLAVEAASSRFLDGCVVEVRQKNVVSHAPFNPTTPKITAVVDAVRRAIHKDRDDFELPCWLEPGHPPAVEFIACANGLLHWPTMQLHPLTPLFATRNVLELAYDPAVECPRWRQFLDEVLPANKAGQECLQEIIGYILSGDTSLQKIFMLLGASRSGKGTILRVLQALLGEANFCNLSLGAFGDTFGLQGAIGRQAIIITDARVDRDTPKARVVEVILNISGEDSLQVQRKYKPPYNGRLGGRILIATNEMPSLPDTGGALANRFIVLTFSESFLNREDFTLMDKLATELPGILNWALAGLHRLRRRGRFAPPPESTETVAEMDEAGSPVGSFVNDCCIQEAGAKVPKYDVWNVWRIYARAHEYRVLTPRDFAIALYAATQHRVKSKRTGNPKTPHFVNLRLPVNEWIRAARLGAYDEDDGVEIPPDLLKEKVE